MEIVHGLVETAEMPFKIEVERQSKYLLSFSLFVLDFDLRRLMRGGAIQIIFFIKYIWKQLEGRALFWILRPS